MSWNDVQSVLTKYTLGVDKVYFVSFVPLPTSTLLIAKTKRAVGGATSAVARKQNIEGVGGAVDEGSGTQTQMNGGSKV